ncbi:MAG: hypothetical protein RLZZ428_746 [Pseudomonadota bacterium]|jgi:signal transduction histidine kinase
MNFNPFIPPKDIKQSHVDTLYKVSEKSLIVLMFFAFFAALSMYDALSIEAFGWISGIVFLALLRLKYARDYRKKGSMNTTVYWYKKFRFGTFLTAIYICIVGIAFILKTDEVHQLLTIMMLLTALTGVNQGLITDKYIVFYYNTIILLPLSITILITDSHMKLILFFLLLFFYLGQIMMIYRYTSKIDEISSVLEDHQRFIADTVHQIRTPLTVIMSNLSLIELKTNDTILPYTKQIHASINLLSNSYEDLSYLLFHNAVKYQKKIIHLSTYLQERILFFAPIVEVHSKLLTQNIQEDIYIRANQIELERIIDNNLSNAIKHSKDKSHIEVVLTSDPKHAMLKFVSEGLPIQNKAKIFEKHYSENTLSKRSLGLGLSMVKMICEKNGIHYSVTSENEQNIFIYTFKTIEING